MDWALTANVYTSGGIFLAGAAFAVIYQRVAPWWATRVGRHLMALTGTVALFGVYTVLIYLWPGGRIAAALRLGRVAIGAAMIVLLIRQSWLLIRTQREGRAREKAADDEPPD